MIARVRKSLDENQKGFTLVELLVVIIIIGILAAIAIPLYLDQQKKAADAAAKSDLANARIAVANNLVEDPSNQSIDLDADPSFTASGNVEVSSPVTISDDGVFCIVATADGGKVGTFSTNQTGTLFESDDCTTP